MRDGSKLEILKDQIVVRRAFIHPKYKFRSLYEDLAVLELGMYKVFVLVDRKFRKYDFFEWLAVVPKEKADNIWQLAQCPDIFCSIFGVL